MKFKVKRYGIDIIPENEQDKAYIEDTLGLKHGEDSTPCVRKNAIGMHSIASLTITKEPK